MTNLESKRLKEKEMVSFMIELYCKKNHHPKGRLCAECAALERYAFDRSDHCPFMENKTFCANCSVHCYKPDMKEQIRTVMRFSGPRMILHRPRAALYHLYTTKKEKHRLKNKA